jgi:hypothetical protein
MANSKISALTLASTPLAGTETLPIVQSSATTKVTVENLTAGRAVAMATNSGLSGNISAPVIFKISNSSASTSAGTQLQMLYGITSVGYVYNRFNGGDFETQIQGNDSVILKTGGSGGTDVVKFTSAGNMNVSNATKGINFSANTPTAGMTSQLLNWYEEGTWTPNQGSGLTVVGAFSSTGKYTRVGRNLTISGTVTGATSVAVAAAGVITTNLPFTVGTAGHGNVTNAALTSFSAIICTSTNVTSAGAIAATGTLTFSATYFV